MSTTSELSKSFLEAISVKYNPARCYLYSGKIAGIVDAIKLPSKTVYDIGKDFSVQMCLAKYGEDAIRKMSVEQQKEIVKEHYPKAEIMRLMSMWVADLSQNLNLKRNLTESQILFVSERLFSKYSWKITDLTLFFRNVKEGVYGDLYENLSPEKIIQWADTYHSERAGVAETISNEEKPFSVTKDKMDPKVAEAIFKDVGEETQEARETKKEVTVFDSYEKHLEYMKNLASQATPQQLVSFIQEHFLKSNMSAYVDVFNGYLTDHEDKKCKQFHDMVWEASVKFEDFSRNGTEDSKIRYEVLSKKILKFKL